MADKLHFDMDKALDDFLAVFWQKGYRYTTTKELARNAGISEGSLFNSFGSKKKIYVMALKRFRERNRDIRELMKKNPSALGGIRQYLEVLGKLAVIPGNTQGCMITNATIEISEDSEIRDYLKSVHLNYDTEFKRALDRAVKLGELRPDTNTTALAQYLSHSVQGLKVLSRMNPSKKKVANIIQLTMGTVDQYQA